jgi:hypothetical protein
MSGMAEFNTASNADTEREHEMQLGLLRELCKTAGATAIPRSSAKSSSA